jgi:hypothetical protein
MLRDDADHGSAWDLVFGFPDAHPWSPSTRQIEEGLRAHYADLLALPLPERLTELARELETKLQEDPRGG